MSQYITGTVQVTEGSPTVTGDTSAWSSNVNPGDMFTLRQNGVSNPVYQVASVTDDTTLVLTAPYAGTSLTGQSYVIARDFTPNLSLPLVAKGNLETASLLGEALMIIDDSIAFTVNTDIVSAESGQTLVYDGTKWVNAFISTTGTITTGTWEGTDVAVGYGGTGLSTTPSNGNLLIGNGSGYTLADLTAGTGITVTNGSGSIEITNAGVTSLTGTTNQVNISADTGSITLSLPQSIATTSTPTFAQGTISNAPVNATDIATKYYVDTVAQGLEIHQAVIALVSSNISISSPGTSTFDSVTVTSGNRLLLIDQTTSSQNGIWVFNGSSSALTRPTDFNASIDGGSFTDWAGSAVFISQGTTYGNTLWVLTTINPITIDTTGETWTQFGGPGTYTAGSGLTLTGTQFSLSNPIAPSLGGTGVVNTGTITLSGNLTTSGAYTTELTVTGNTNVTLPTSGTLVNTSVTALSSLATVGTIGTGVWNGTSVGPTYGGTGQTAFTEGDILYASATNTLSRLAVGSSGQILTVVSSVPVWSSAAGYATFANPTNTIGLTANNGSSSSAARADATPALNQAISPTWTGNHTFTNNVVLAAPSSGSTLQVNGTVSHYAEYIVGSSTTSESYGLAIQAGTNSSDAPIYIANYADTATVFAIYGDGHFVLGNNGSTQTISTTSAGNVNINAPTSGAALNVNGAAGTNALTITNSTTTQVSELYISRAGSTANIVAGGPSIEFTDSVNDTVTNIQQSGGQTEFWQYNGGWSQCGFFSTTNVLNLNAGLNIVSGPIELNGSAGAAGQVLTSGGSGTLPTWSDAASSGVTSITGTTNQITASASTGAVTLSLASNLVLTAPSSGSTLQVNGTVSHYAEYIVGSSTTSESYGLAIQAGTNSSDAAIYIANYADTATVFAIYGDGHFVLGNNGSTQTISTTSAGNVNINAPTSGVGLSVSGGINLASGALELDGSAGTSGQVLTSGGSGTLPTWTTLSGGTGITYDAGTITNTGVTSAVAGTGIGVSSSTGAVTITNDGVTSISGTTNEITASVSTGAVTLSLPSSVTISGTMTAGTFDATSDQNLKTNISPIINSGEIIDSIDGVNFNWKKDGKASVGVIAQQVQTVLPAAVHSCINNDEIDEHLTVNYNALVAVLIEQVKDLRARVAQLEDM